MACVFIQEFAIVDGERSTSNYDSVVAELPDTRPDGLIAHTAGFDEKDDVFRIFEVWETRVQGERFMNEQLDPILERLRAGAPKETWRPANRADWYELYNTMR